LYDSIELKGLTYDDDDGNSKSIIGSLPPSDQFRCGALHLALFPLAPLLLTLHSIHLNQPQLERILSINIQAQKMSSFTEKLTAFAEHIAYPNKSENLGHLEHDAAHGSCLVDHEPSTGVWGESFSSLSVDFRFFPFLWLTRINISLDRLHGENTARQIRSQGDCGVGMEDGLQRKAIRQQEVRFSPVSLHSSSP